MNQANLKGNIGADPEFKSTSGGKMILKFSLATSEKWKDQNGQLQERTEWHRIVFFGKRAEGLARHLSKGTSVLVTGKIHYGSYEKDGIKHNTTEIHGADLEFCGSKQQGQQRPAARTPDPDLGGDGYGDNEAEAEAMASSNDPEW